MQQEPQYRVATVDSDGSYYETDPVDRADAFLDLSLTKALHIIGGWTVEGCSCGLGIICRNGSDLYRAVHVIPADEDSGASDSLEDIALAVGVLAPASLNGRLEVVEL